MLKSQARNVVKRWSNLRKPSFFSFIFAFLGLLTGVMALIGYEAEKTWLYRPVGESATHSLTAITAMLLSAALIISMFNKHWCQKTSLLLTSVSLLVSITRLLEGNLLPYNFLESLTPYMDAINAEIGMGLRNEMAVNTALMFLLLSLSKLMFLRGKELTSQFIALVTLLLPLVSIVGYVYKVEVFYGDQSIATAIIGLFVNISVLLRSANTGILKYLSSPYQGGRMARMQLAIGYISPLLMAYFIIHFNQTGRGDLIGLVILLTGVLFVIAISLSAFIVEKSDEKRRISEEKLTELAYTDTLTGLYNRRIYFEHGNYLFNVKKRDSINCWVSMIDVDFFKRVNDKFGHSMGDSVLVKISEALKNNLRDSDLVARLGGEEFGLILTNVDEFAINDVFLKLQYEIGGLTKSSFKEKELWPITVSIGAYKITGEENSFDECLNNSDKALYEAKRLGRDQIVYWNSDLNY